MLARLDLHYFKCFGGLKLPLKPLTLLSGANASGKSSVLQALVLLHQTMREDEWSSELVLNGASVNLGTAADVIDHLLGSRHCRIGLQDSTGSHYEWEFEGDRDDMVLEIQQVHIKSEDGTKESFHRGEALHYMLPQLPIVQDSLHSLTDRLIQLSYLTAERLGPREIYVLEGPRPAPVVGPNGEHTLELLHRADDGRVLDELMIEGVPPKPMRQVEAHMAQFFPSCELAFSIVPNASAVTLGIRTSRSTEFHRPVNTGFGITQVLPIVVAALTARKQDILLIENPEVHLHPAGQAMMGEFLARVASAEVQVVLETHSDHVLNGVRRAVKNNILSSDSALLHFFRPRHEIEGGNGEQVESPTVDVNGNIDVWPDGFFDQLDKDLAQFAGWN